MLMHTDPVLNYTHSSADSKAVVWLDGKSVGAGYLKHSNGTYHTKLQSLHKIVGADLLRECFVKNCRN